MLIIRKNKEKLTLIQDNKEYKNFVLHMMSGVIVITGIFPPTFILFTAPMTLLIFYLIILGIFYFKNKKIAKKITVILEKNKLSIEKNKKIEILYENIIDITIKNKKYYTIEISLKNQEKITIEAMIFYEAEKIKNIVIKYMEERNDLRD